MKKQLVPTPKLQLSRETLCRLGPQLLVLPEGGGATTGDSMPCTLTINYTLRACGSD